VLEKAPEKYKSILTAEQRHKGTGLTLSDHNSCMNDLFRTMDSNTKAVTKAENKVSLAASGFKFKGNCNYCKKPGPHFFQCLSPYAARKTLGCFKTPSSNFKQSLQHIQAIAMEKSKLLLHHYVDVKSAYQFYFSIFLPSVTYSFPTNTIPEGPLTIVQNASVRSILSRMKLDQNIPHAILYGPQSLGGVAFDRSTTSRDRPRWN
jgi:hypothetical protein